MRYYVKLFKKLMPKFTLKLFVLTVVRPWENSFHSESNNLYNFKRICKFFFLQFLWYQTRKVCKLRFTNLVTFNKQRPQYWGQNKNADIFNLTNLYSTTSLALYIGLLWIIENLSKGNLIKHVSYIYYLVEKFLVCYIISLSQIELFKFK